MNSEAIHDAILIELFKGNISYNIVNSKTIYGFHQLSTSIINISLVIFYYY